MGLAVGARIGEKAADRGGYVLRLADYEATILGGVPVVPQPDDSMTQYTACRYTADPGNLAEAAARGSLCAQLFLEDNSKKRPAAGDPRERGEDGGAAGTSDGPRRFRERAGLSGLIDVHTHFMPERLLAAVRAYFDAAGPLIGRPWPIVYRQDEAARVATLRAFGVGAFTALLYPHKPGMARSLNDWAADFAARTPDCLHTATFFAEPSAAADVRRALEQGARVFKCHVQVGDFDPNDPLLDEAWGLLAEAGVPVVTHCGSGPVPGRYTGPGPAAGAARPPPPAAPRGRAPGHAGVRGVPRPRRAPRSVLLDTTLAFTPFIDGAAAPFPPAALPRLRDLGDRVLLGTDFPNIPHSYPTRWSPWSGPAGAAWLRAVCHDNAARLFAR